MTPTFRRNIGRLLSVAGDASLKPSHPAIAARESTPPEGRIASTEAHPGHTPKVQVPPRAEPQTDHALTGPLSPPRSAGGNGQKPPAAPEAGSRVPRELPVIPISPSAGIYQRGGKRVLDCSLTFLALILLLPLLLLIAAAIKLEGPGPILYRSWRVGRGGRRFLFLKFRSMIPGADAWRDTLSHLNEVEGPVFKIAQDPRITRVGRVLRKTSLDELPQFWNILRGDMSLVGPRPPLSEEVIQYEPWQLRRLSVRPGLTCLWQISGRSRIGFDEWMRLDMEYIDRRSIGLDLEILLRTIPAVLSGEGAY